MAVNKIFSLLDGEAEVAGHAWELIQLLPVNSAMREQIWASASSHNWSSLIDVRSCYSLLYSVKIVEVTSCTIFSWVCTIHC